MKKLKFEIGDLKTIAIILAVVGLVLAFTLQIMGDVQDDMTASSAEANATQDGIDALSTISGKLGLIALVVVAVILIGLLVRYLGRM